MKTTVYYHSADFDGLFCREIARKFLPDAEFIGWDFKDAPLPIPDGKIYILDLPVDRVFGYTFVKGAEWPTDGIKERIIWIDHHKSSIESHPTDIPGYRIDGVAACRLAWQWFTHQVQRDTDTGKGQTVALLPTDVQFKNREVSEPIAVRLAGEYDVWCHEPSGHDDVRFQFGLDSQFALNWELLLDIGENSDLETKRIVHDGQAAQQCYAKRDADVMRERSFLVEFEGLKFLALNTARCNSNTFTARDVKETGHDALMAFCYTGDLFLVSLYHAAHNKEIDLSLIAVKYGGGGHKGACGFRANEMGAILGSSHF